MTYFWLAHPQRPEEQVLVFRGFWGRLFKPRQRATHTEAERFELYALALEERRYGEFMALDLEFDA